MRHYPLQQARASLANLGAQLGDFAPTEFHWGGDVAIKGGLYVSHLARPPVAVLGYLTVLHYAATIAAAGTLVYSLLRSHGMHARWRQAMVLVAIAVFANAGVCGVLWEPSPRYEARVTWLVVAVGLVFATDCLRTRSAKGVQWRRIGASDPPRAWGS